MKEKILLVIIAMVLIAVFVTGVWRLTSEGLDEWTIRVYQGRMELEDIISLIGMYASIIDNYDYIMYQRFSYITASDGMSAIMVTDLTGSTAVKIWEGHLYDDTGVTSIMQAFTHTILPIDSALFGYLGGTFTTVGLITGKIGTAIMRAINATMWLIGFV